LAGDDDAGLNLRIQAARCLPLRSGGSAAGSPNRIRQDAAGRPSREAVISALVALLDDDNARLRFAAVDAIGQAPLTQAAAAVRQHLGSETDRVTFYATWNALRRLASAESRRGWLAESTGRVRLGLLLGLMADDQITAEQVRLFRDDADRQVAEICNRWLVQTGAETPLVEISPPAGRFVEPVSVTLRTDRAGHRITYTTDGSTPTGTSPPYRGPIPVDRTTTLRVGVFRGNDIAGRVVTAEFQIVPPPPYRGRRFLSHVVAASGRAYEVDYDGLRLGKRVYTDRGYAVTGLPDELRQSTFLRTANADDRSGGDQWLSFESDIAVDVLVGVDSRNPEPLSWMNVSRPGGFQDTDWELQTDDADFHFYRRRFPAGRIVLGGNTNAPDDSGRGNYIVAFRRERMTPPAEPVTVDHPAGLIRVSIRCAMSTDLADRVVSVALGDSVTVHAVIESMFFELATSKDDRRLSVNLSHAVPTG